jgi:xanthine dehydrogenase YagR molybdenum-binding subunit
MTTDPLLNTAAGPIGKPISRVDGRLKVTGHAKYAGENHVPDLAYGVVVSSTIARGKIRSIDTAAAEEFPGVVKVFTHENRPNLAWFNSKYKDDDAPKGQHFRPLYDDHILYSGQPIALVVADTFEAARYAASLVQAHYEEAPHVTELACKADDAFDVGKEKEGFEPPPPPRGKPEEAFAAAPVQISRRYHSAMEHHNPMEPFASTVHYEGEGKLTIWDKTQGIVNSHTYVCNVFGLSKKNVRIHSPFVGGAFGSGLRPQHQLFMAVMAALELRRSVRCTLTRQQMFTFGHRPETRQDVALGALPDGTLQSIMHEALAETSSFENYAEIVVNWSGSLYACDNVKLQHKLARLDVYTPLDMRAPGAAHGLFALETAMDELAYQLNMCPLALRLKNFAQTDPSNGKPFSSKELRACYEQGAERFGWSKRNPAPRSMRDKNELIGWGMATGVWEAMQMKAAARATLNLAGKLTVSSATADIGTGTYTLMAQIAAETLGLPIEEVTATLGDSTLPPAPLQGGSFTAASVGTAVHAACEAVVKKLLAIANKIGAPFAKATRDDIVLMNGCLALKNDPTRAVPFPTLLQHAGVDHLEEEATVSPEYLQQNKFSRNTHSAVFVEVKVDEDLGTMRVTRAVSAVAAGRIINPKTSRSQILGGVVWGISAALHEESLTDHHLGRIMNHNLSEYHVPVNADIHDIDVIFVEEFDKIASPLGIKGLGEIGIVGTAAAVGNAIFHATGKRIRSLPITLDKLL